MFVFACARAHCDPVDCSPPGSSVHGILQARILEWVAIPSPGDLPDPGIESRSPALQADSLPTEPPGKWLPTLVNVCISRSVMLTLHDSTDCGPTGFSAHGILQARILEWVAVPFSRGSSQPRDQTLVSSIAGRFFTI